MATGVINSTSRLHVVARHHHLHAFRQLRHAGHVRGPEVELRPIALEERRVPPALVLRQHVDFALELLVRLDRSRLRDHLPALHVGLFNSAQQQAHVVAGAAFVQQLLEHLHARHHRLARIAEPDDLHFLADLADALFDSARHHRAAALNRENVFDRHQERLVDLARRHAGCTCRRRPSARPPSFPTSLRRSDAPSALTLITGRSLPGKP